MSSMRLPCQQFQNNLWNAHLIVSQLTSCLACSTRRFHVIPLSRYKSKADHSLLQANTLSYTSRCRSSDSIKNQSSILPVLHPSAWAQQFSLLEPELDWEYLLHPDNTDAIHANIHSRKGKGDINKVIGLANLYLETENDEAKEEFRQMMLSEALKIPNKSHPNVIIGPESKAMKVETCGVKKQFDFTPKLGDFVGQQKGLNMLRLKNLSLAHGEGTCYLEAGLAELERALTSYTLDVLMDRGFELVSVPDILYTDTVEAAGQSTAMNRGIGGTTSAVYHMLPECLPAACMSGTSEMSLAGFFANEELSLEDLPRRMCALSRCFRAEADQQGEQTGTYRLHLFNKVEMFGVTADESGSESEALLQEFLDIQRDIFSQLGLHFRVLDMPSEELGAPAYRKYDMEAWMYARKKWGEISSASNCTDFQTRRLNIRYKGQDGELRHAHTVNGTACAVPRLMISILEGNQEFEDGHLYLWKIRVPSVLKPYMDGKEFLRKTEKNAAWVYHQLVR